MDLGSRRRHYVSLVLWVLLLLVHPPSWVLLQLRDRPEKIVDHLTVLCWISGFLQLLKLDPWFGFSWSSINSTRVFFFFLTRCLGRRFTCQPQPRKMLVLCCLWNWSFCPSRELAIVYSGSLVMFFKNFLDSPWNFWRSRLKIALGRMLLYLRRTSVRVFFFGDSRKLWKKIPFVKMSEVLEGFLETEVTVVF